ncbi:hypothetical protein T02_10433, partial [Trichinella nativa]
LISSVDDRSGDCRKRREPDAIFIDFLSDYPQLSVIPLSKLFRLSFEFLKNSYRPITAELGVVLQPQTVICDFETALIPAVQASFPGVQIQGCYFHFCQAVLRKVAELGLRTRYLHEGETKKKIKMLMATAFLPLPEVPAAVELLGRNVTGLIAALIDDPNRLPLWNVYNVQTRTNNHLEGWHLKMNRQAGKHHLSFYELLQLLIDEQGSTETLIQQVTSGRVTANDLRIKNNKYEEVQLRIAVLTAEYDGGTPTMEQFLKAVAYDKHVLPTSLFCIELKREILLNARRGRNKDGAANIRGGMQQCIHQFGNCWSVSSIQKSESGHVQKPGQTFSPTASNTPAAGNSSTMACYEVWPAVFDMKIYGSWLDILSVRRDLPTYNEIFDNLILNAAALGVVLQPQTVIYDFETALIPAVQASFPGVQIQGCYFHFCQAVLRKVAELGLRTRYLHEAETKKKIKMLMATAFLPLPEVPAAVDLLGRNVTGLIAALFDYFRREWMTPNRLPLWNVYNVQTRTNNHLEGWHLKMNRQAGKHHLSFYELLQLLIDEQGSTETLIQQVTSGRVTANDLRIKNNKYEEVQLRITALTAEYDGGTRTMEQFLKAVAYDVPEPINF